jgi:hypothetical protein
MARNPWPAQWTTGTRAHAERFTLKAGSTFSLHALVVLDGSEEVDECGADPSAVLGVAADPAASVIETGFIRVFVADAQTLYACSASSTPTEDNLDQNYGAVKTSGVWLVDLTETTADVWRPVRLLTQGNDTLLLCRFVQGVRQLG